MEAIAKDEGKLNILFVRMEVKELLYCANRTEEFRVRLGYQRSETDTVGTKVLL